MLKPSKRSSLHLFHFSLQSHLIETELSWPLPLHSITPSPQQKFQSFLFLSFLLWNFSFSKFFLKKRNEFRTFKLILWLFYNIESRKFLHGICSRFGYWKVSTFWNWREGRDFFFLLVYFSFLLLIWLIQSSLPFQGILIHK